jgi:hypothetical protein
MARTTKRPILLCMFAFLASMAAASPALAVITVVQADYQNAKIAAGLEYNVPADTIPGRLLVAVVSWSVPCSSIAAPTAAPAGWTLSGAGGDYVDPAGDGLGTCYASYTYYRENAPEYLQDDLLQWYITDIESGSVLFFEVAGIAAAAPEHVATTTYTDLNATQLVATGTATVTWPNTFIVGTIAIASTSAVIVGPLPPEFTAVVTDTDVNSVGEWQLYIGYQIAGAGSRQRYAVTADPVYFLGTIVAFKDDGTGTSPASTTLLLLGSD